MPKLPNNIRPKYLPPKVTQGRRKFDNTMYSTTRWKKLRQNILANEPLCRECDKHDITTIAEVVDHIINVSSGKTKAAQDYLMWDIDNLQPLCHSCHNRKSGREAHLKR